LVAGRAGVTRQEHAYRHLLRLYPATFRDRYEAEMVTLFLDQLRDENAPAKPTASAARWLGTLVDIAKTAPLEHLRREAYVPNPVDPASIRLADAAERSPGARAGYALTSVPIILTVVAMVVAPGFMDPLFANPPAIGGLPAGVALLFIFLVWAVMGILVVRGARSNARVLLALAVFTLPASIAIILGPALILIIQNLAI
jgi:hypothetical protein